MNDIERKIYQLEHEHTTIKEKQSKCSEAIESIKHSYTSLETNISKLTEIAQNTAIIESDLKLLKLEMAHKQDITEGKIKGTKDLTDKDIQEIKRDLTEIYSLIKKVVWGVVSSFLTGVGYLVFKTIGVM